MSSKKYPLKAAIEMAYADGLISRDEILQCQITTNILTAIIAKMNHLLSYENKILKFVVNEKSKKVVQKYLKEFSASLEEPLQQEKDFGPTDNTEEEILKPNVDTEKKIIFKELLLELEELRNEFTKQTMKSMEFYLNQLNVNKNELNDTLGLSNEIIKEAFMSVSHQMQDILEAVAETNSTYDHLIEECETDEKVMTPPAEEFELDNNNVYSTLTSSAFQPWITIPQILPPDNDACPTELEFPQHSYGLLKRKLFDENSVSTAHSTSTSQRSFKCNILDTEFHFTLLKMSCESSTDLKEIIKFSLREEYKKHNAICTIGYNTFRVSRQGRITAYAYCNDKACCKFKFVGHIDQTMRVYRSGEIRHMNEHSKRKRYEISIVDNEVEPEYVYVNNVFKK